MLKYYALFNGATAILGILLSTTALSTSPLVQAISIADWQPQMGDHILVDTRENEGYLVHPNGGYLPFPVVTGKRKIVRYIGRTYDATTPARTWTMTSREIKWDRITFGPSGRFLRLSSQGEKTPYGFHEYAHEDEMFALAPRYGSMGCIIVRSTILDVIEKTFNLNEGALQVSTQYGVDPTLFVLH